VYDNNLSFIVMQQQALPAMRETLEIYAFFHFSFNKFHQNFMFLQSLYNAMNEWKSE